MASQEDIDRQLGLLATYRRTLAHLLQQAASYGGETYVPPHVANGMHEAREHIRRIKATLRGWGVQVEDQADNAAAPMPHHCAGARHSGSIRTVEQSQLYKTAFADPQLELWELDDDQ